MFEYLRIYTHLLKLVQYQLIIIVYHFSHLHFYDQKAYQVHILISHNVRLNIF
jgi:hypothetical protein